MNSAAFAVGNPCRRSRSTVRQMRTSAAARRACRPSCRSRAGAKPANVVAVGGACRSVPSTRGVAARTICTSSCRARRESISCPQNARRSVCATVGSRSWRMPWNRNVVSPMSGSQAKRRRNSEWSASIASRKRSRSKPSSLAARSTTRPSTVWRAEPTSTPSPTWSVVVSVPSRRWRVASLACLVHRASVNGPAGRTTRSNVNACGVLQSRRPRRDRMRAGG
jgi:hypothetical protein